MARKEVRPWILRLWCRMTWALTPLTEEQRAIQQTAREFARHELAPHVDQRDRDAHFEPDVIDKLAALGRSEERRVGKEWGWQWAERSKRQTERRETRERRE